MNFKEIKLRLSKVQRTRRTIISKCNKEIEKLMMALEKACDHPADEIEFWTSDAESAI